MRTRLLFTVSVFLLGGCGGSAADLKGSTWLSSSGRVYEFRTDGSLLRTSGFKPEAGGKWTFQEGSLSGMNKGTWKRQGDALTISYAGDLVFTETIVNLTEASMTLRSKKSGKERKLQRVRVLERGSNGAPRVVGSP